MWLGLGLVLSQFLIVFTCYVFYFDEFDLFPDAVYLLCCGKSTGFIQFPVVFEMSVFEALFYGIDYGLFHFNV